MQKLILSAAALIGLTAGVHAADLPRRAVPLAPAPVIAGPVFTWNGFYAGVNAGYGFNADDNDGLGVLRTPSPGGGVSFSVAPPGGGTFLRRSDDDGGILGGAQAGYNMQFGMIVAGIEADIQAIDLDSDGGLPRGPSLAGWRNGADPAFGIAISNYPGGNVYFRRDNGQSGMDVFGTVRGRVGVAFGRAMIYATGGLAWKAGEDDGPGAPPPIFWSVFSPGAAARGAQVVARMNNEDDENIGWTVGGGVEYAFTNAVSAKIEGLYVNIGDDSRGRRIVGVTNTGQPITLNGRRDDYGQFGLVRAGPNFRFGTF